MFDGIDRTDHDVMKALMKSLSKVTAENAQLIAKNEDLTAKNVELTAANTKLTAEHKQLQDKSKQQASTLKHSMQQKQVMLEELEKLQKLETDLTKTQKRNADLTCFLTDLTAMLTSLQNEAEQAASALKEAQEPATTRYQSEHEQLLKQLRIVRDSYRSSLEQQAALKQQVEDAIANNKNLYDQIKLFRAAAEHKTVNKAPVTSAPQCIRQPRPRVYLKEGRER